MPGGLLARKTGCRLPWVRKSEGSAAVQVDDQETKIAKRQATMLEVKVLAIGILREPGNE